MLSVALARFLHITFAMLTLVAGQLVYLVAFQTNLVGGENGIAPVLRGSFLGISLETDVNFWPYAVVVLGIICVLYWRFHRSMFVLRLMASRDDELRAQSLGLNIVVLRGVAGAVAGGVAGLGGGLYAQYAGAVNPTLLYFDMSGIAIFMCLLGGARYLWGPLVGGVIYAVGVGDFLSNTSQPDVYIGIAFMLVIILLPGGLLSLQSRLGGLRGHASAAAATSPGPQRNRLMTLTVSTRACDLLGITKPIILAGMGAAASPALAAAVSNAGGLGVIGAADLEPDRLNNAIDEVRKATSQPFGVDTLIPSGNPETLTLDDILERIPEPPTSTRPGRSARSTACPTFPCPGCGPGSARTSTARRWT